MYAVVQNTLEINKFNDLNPNIFSWVITNSDKPLIAYLKNIGELKFNIPKIDNLIDAGGAGDAFMGMYIYQIYKMYENG